MISYAQNFEDVMLWRALKHLNSGFYIDVGANDPRLDSVTKAFYDHGWRGINIEPVFEWFEKLSNDRSRDINLQLAAGAEQGEITLYEIPETGLSTVDKSIAERHESERGYKKIARKVPIKTITAICEEYHVAPIHFLKIDVEGAEKQVLEGVDFSKIRPWIILLEATVPNTQIKDHQSWEPILLSNNYEFVYFDGLNRFYVAKEHSQIKESFSLPPNVFDEFVQIKEIDTNARAQQVEAQAVEAHARAEQAEGRLQEMTAWVRRAESQADAANARAKQAEGRVQEVTARVEQAEGRVQEVTARAEQAEGRVQEVTARAERAEDRVQEVTARAERAEGRVQEVTAKAEQAEGRVQEVTARAEQAELQAQEVSARVEQAESQAVDAESRTEQAETLYSNLYNSKSWRITYPLRQASMFTQWFIRGSVAWLTLTSGSRPSRVLKKILIKLKIYLSTKPKLQAKLIRALNCFPGFKLRLKKMTCYGRLALPQASEQILSLSLEQPSLQADEQALNQHLKHLTPRARSIYMQLTNAIEKKQEPS